jgi:hypothetical protein
VSGLTTGHSSLSFGCARGVPHGFASTSRPPHGFATGMLTGLPLKFGPVSRRRAGMGRSRSPLMLGPVRYCGVRSGNCRVMSPDRRMRQ